ncbi:hypothetical protein GALMADRAFT_212106 [Galerina marginata CBS 339.88]|uniref:Uncharacterized protein n=1 Tax=Galerina marginata (strain CBS 339.88) TaxID=685588 RepID=A0A067T1Q0_GALM3|nr:hypothetical protein GALMADRAFT_212106 [Galerina marginata CBS 339.88]
MTLFISDESGGSWFNSIPVAFPFTVWAADGFMIWRCIVLYQGVSTMYRILLISAVFLLALISLGLTRNSRSAISHGYDSAAGSIYLIPFSSHAKEILFSYESGPMYQAFDRAALIVPTASTIVNIVLSALIIFRALYHQRHSRTALGTAHASIYSQIVALCIESCALISIVGVVYMVIVLSNLPGMEVPLYLLPQICECYAAGQAIQIVGKKVPTRVLGRDVAVVAVAYKSGNRNYQTENIDVIMPELLVEMPE